MNAYRKAFFILARRRHTAIRQIGLPYLLSAVSAAILAVGLASAVYHCIAPMLALMLENVEPSVAFSAIGLDWPLIRFFVFCTSRDIADVAFSTMDANA